MSAKRMRILLAVTVASVLVAGCNDDAGDDGATTTTVTTPGGVTTVTSAPGSSSSTTSQPPTTALVLRPDGVGPVSFGMPKPDVLAALEDAIGPVDETGPGCELAGPTATTVRWKELRLQFVDDQFDSYHVRPPTGVSPVLGLETADGIELGSKVADLQATYGARLAIPGLPPEFGGMDFAISFPGTDRKILGTLSDTTATGTVTAFFTQACE